MILSTEEGNKLSDVIRDFKSFTSTKLKNCIKENSTESCREWLVWMFERAGKKNRISRLQLWQQHNHPIELSNDVLMD
nr:hypothetical protein [Fulvivirga marina]